MAGSSDRERDLPRERSETGLELGWGPWSTTCKVKALVSRPLSSLPLSRSFIHEEAHTSFSSCTHTPFKNLFQSSFYVFLCGNIHVFRCPVLGISANAKSCLPCHSRDTEQLHHPQKFPHAPCVDSPLPTPLIPGNRGSDLHQYSLSFPERAFKWNYAVCSSLSLVSFTQHNALNAHPCCL